MRNTCPYDTTPSQTPPKLNVTGCTQPAGLLDYIRSTGVSVCLDFILKLPSYIWTRGDKSNMAFVFMCWSYNLNNIRKGKERAECRGRGRGGAWASR